VLGRFGPLGAFAMPSLPSIPHVPRDVLVGIGAVAALLVLWLCARYSRRHYVMIGKSDATEAITSELGRIADALERLAALAAPRETQSPVDERPSRREDWMSLFRR